MNKQTNKSRPNTKLSVKRLRGLTVRTTVKSGKKAG